MKAKKQDAINSILFFAKKYNAENNYKAIMDAYGIILPELIKMISYDLFLNKFNSYACTDEEYEHYKLIHKYATELQKDGFVEFEED